MAAGVAASSGIGRSGVGPDMTGEDILRWLVMAVLAWLLLTELRGAWQGWRERQRRAAEQRERVRRMGRGTGRRR